MFIYLSYVNNRYQDNQSGIAINPNLVVLIVVKRPQASVVLLAR